MNEHSHKLILGSSSIFRKELLQRLQIPFETMSPNIDEVSLEHETSEETALRLAAAKARMVATRYPHALIIGSDQVAVLGNERLGKPLNHANATAQLRLIQGKEVFFHTAICLFNSATDRLQTRLVSYRVKFRSLTPQQIEGYLQKEQPYHCAGSAKSEGLGIALIERMTGDDPNALIGLPLIALIDMLGNEDVRVI